MLNVTFIRYWLFSVCQCSLDELRYQQLSISSSQIIFNNLLRASRVKEYFLVCIVLLHKLKTDLNKGSFGVCVCKDPSQIFNFLPHRHRLTAGALGHNPEP
jgi:hypothetical protein